MNFSSRDLCNLSLNPCKLPAAPTSFGKSYTSTACCMKKPKFGFFWAWLLPRASLDGPRILHWKRQQGASSYPLCPFCSSLCRSITSLLNQMVPVYAAHSCYRSHSTLLVIPWTPPSYTMTYWRWKGHSACGWTLIHRVNLLSFSSLNVWLTFWLLLSTETMFSWNQLL